MANIVFSTFLILAPALLALRLFNPQKMPWLELILLQVVLGWTLLAFCQWLWSTDFNEQMAAYLNADGTISSAAPTELIEKWQAQDGGNVLSFILGWLYAVSYLIFWLPIYGVVWLISQKVNCPRKNVFLWIVNSRSFRRRRH